MQTAVREHLEAPVAPQPRGSSFAEFATVPSNIGAVEVGTRFAQGVTPFAVVIGASGWGKTHLLESVSSFMERRTGTASAPLTAKQFVSGADSIAGQAQLMIDDAQDAMSSLRPKQEFRRLLERRCKAGKPTFLCLSDKVSRLEVARYLPCPQEWAYQTITVPNKKERDYIVRQIADSEEVSLSGPIVTMIARHLCGDGRSIKGAVRTLKSVREDWSRRADLFEACGVLSPYIEGEDGWDPRDLVAEVVSKRTFDCDGQQGFADAVCAYVMVSLMGLSEFDVATFMGVTPSAAYAMSVRVKENMGNQGCAKSIEECKDAIVRTLDSEVC